MLSLLWQHLAEHSFFHSDPFIHCGQVNQLLRLNIWASDIPLTKNIYGVFGANGIVYRDCQFCVRFFVLGNLPNEWCVRNNAFIQDRSSVFLRRCFNKHYYLWNRSSSLFFWNTTFRNWIAFCQWSATEACYFCRRQMRRNPYIKPGSVACIIYRRNS